MDLVTFHRHYNINNLSFNIINFCEESFIANSSFKVNQSFDGLFLTSDIDIDFFIESNKTNFESNTDFSFLVGLLLGLAKIQNLISNRYYSDEIYLKNVKIKFNCFDNKNLKSSFFKFSFEIQGVGNIECHSAAIKSNQDIVKFISELKISRMITDFLTINKKY